MSSLVLRATLGIHRIPANTKMKRILWLQNANISQLSQGAGHQWGTTQQNSRCSPVLSLSCSCMSPARKGPESSHLCRDSINAVQVLC